MDTIAVSVIVGYLVVTTAVGSLFARRSRSSSGWATAGSGMGVVMIAVGLAGTRIGGVGTYGVADDVMKTGLWNLWFGINTFLALALVGVFFAIPYRRLRLSTVSEIFWVRFGSRRCQVLTSLCVQTEYLIVNILEPLVIGSILSGITGMPFGVGVFVGAFVLIVYTTLGGLWGSAATNLIHCAVMILGLLTVGLFGLEELGGWEQMTTKIDAALASADRPFPSVSWWSWIGAGWAAVLAMFFSATIHTPAASIYVNFSSAARRERDLVPAFIAGGLIASVMPFLAGWIGMETLATYGSESGLRSYSLLTEMAVSLSPWIGGIAVAAILAAVISSGGPILLSSSTLFVQDWLPSSRQMSSERRLRAYRITTVVYGLIAASIAWLGNITSILDLLLLGFAAVVPPAIAVGYLIYWKRTTEKACFWGIALGYGVGLGWYGLIQWADWVGLEAGEGAGFLTRLFHRLFAYEGKGIDPTYPATLIPLVAVPLISIWTRKEARDDERQAKFYDRLSRQAEGPPA